MNKSEWLKKLEEIKKESGVASSKYKNEYWKYHKEYGHPGRALPRPGDATNGKKERKGRTFFGKRGGDSDEV